MLRTRRLVAAAPSESFTHFIVATPRRSHPRPGLLSHGSSSASFVPRRRLLDEMPQRASSVFRALRSLKNSTTRDAGVVASVHCLSLRTNALADNSARTSLLAAYARARDLDSSLALFEEAGTGDVILWNAMISAFVVNCRFGSAVALFREMLCVLGEFDSTTSVIVLSSLSRSSGLKRGKILHGAVIKRCFDSDQCVCNALVDMYAKSGDFSSAAIVFQVMGAKDATSWNSMITAGVYNSLPEMSLHYFRELRRSGIGADEVGLSGVIAACSLDDVISGFGESVHGLVIKTGYEAVPFSSVSHALITYYSRNGAVEMAKVVFRALSCENVVSWNSMISGLVLNERYDEALNYFLEMQSRYGIRPDNTTLLNAVAAIGECGLLRQGKSVHGYALRGTLLASDSSTGNAILYMYLKNNDFPYANHFFTNMPCKDLISWNTMISGCSHDYLSQEEARVLFRALLRTGMTCNLVTLLAILRSCTCVQDLSYGQSIHSWNIRYGLANSVTAINALMLMYTNCGDMNAPSMLLKCSMSLSDIISWNTVMVGYVQNGFYDDALEAFMFLRCSLLLKPDSITFVNALSACGNLALLPSGHYIHCLAIKNSMIFFLQVRNALLTMYFRCGDAESAEIVFHMYDYRNLCTWNCMMSGFVHKKDGLRSLGFFCDLDDFVPNEFSIVSILCACTQLGDLRHGKEINSYVFRFGLLSNPFILSALVDMYSKCGRLDLSLKVFENTREKSTASWNSMIAAYAFHGHPRKSIELFWKMNDLGVKATKSTFISLLSACNHSGLVDEGWRHYTLMEAKFGIKPTVEHHVCMVDMLGRAGLLKEAYKFVLKMPFKTEAGAWGALLRACHDHVNPHMGKSIAENLFFSEHENTGYYITLSNLFAYSEMWSDAAKVRSMIQARALSKIPGRSMIDVLSR